MHLVEVEGAVLVEVDILEGRLECACVGRARGADADRLDELLLDRVHLGGMEAGTRARAAPRR